MRASLPAAIIRFGFCAAQLIYLIAGGLHRYPALRVALIVWGAIAILSYPIDMALRWRSHGS